MAERRVDTRARVFLLARGEIDSFLGRTKTRQGKIPNLRGGSAMETFGEIILLAMSLSPVQCADCPVFPHWNRHISEVAPIKCAVRMTLSHLGHTNILKMSYLNDTFLRKIRFIGRFSSSTFYRSDLRSKWNHSPVNLSMVNSELPSSDQKLNFWVTTSSERARLTSPSPLPTSSPNAF